MIIKSNYNGNAERRVVIVCMDDACFCTSEDESEIKIQEIIKCHTKMR